MKTTKPKIPRLVYLRYTLMNLPGVAVFIIVLLIVKHWVDLPAWLFWVLIICWIAKDVALFPLVWRAYDPHDESPAGALIGECGVVIKPVDPSGYVQIRGELWRAERLEAGPPLPTGTPVRVEKQKGLTLYVVPEGNGRSLSDSSFCEQKQNQCSTRSGQRNVARQRKSDYHGDNSHLDESKP